MTRVTNQFGGERPTPGVVGHIAGEVLIPAPSHPVPEINTTPEDESMAFLDRPVQHVDIPGVKLGEKIIAAGWRKPDTVGMARLNETYTDIRLGYMARLLMYEDAVNGVATGRYAPHGDERPDASRVVVPFRAPQRNKHHRRTA